MCANVTLYQYNCLTKRPCRKGVERTQMGRRRDAGLTQCRRKAGAERRRTDASRRRQKAWTQEGRMTDADGSISYSLTHKMFIVFGSFVACNRYTSVT